MTEFSLKITLNGAEYTDEQLQRLKYERALHVLHEFKQLGVKITDEDGKEYSDIDLNWLEPEKAIDLLVKTHAKLGTDETLKIMKPVLEDSAKRWSDFNKRPIEEQGCWVGTTKFEVKGLAFKEFQAQFATAQNGDTPFKIMPEHYGVVGSIDEGQTIVEAFGCFGEPVVTEGVNSQQIPEYTGVERHEDYPMIIAGELSLKETGENIHVGAIHQFKPTEDGFNIISSYFCPKDAPEAIAQGHTIHFALEIGEMIKMIAKNR